MINAALEDVMGCRIRTHYGTGGVAESYSGPYGTAGGIWTIRYRDNTDGMCWLNTIRIEDGIVTCEHKPLQIGPRAEQVQGRLF